MTVLPINGTYRLHGRNSNREYFLFVQDMVLFNDTIFYNISYGRPEASAEEVYDAARRVRGITPCMLLRTQPSHT